MRVEWRRDEETGATGALDAAAADLSESIRDEIARDGPITFARFMERALYDPERGYYSTAATRPTRAGDFVTAPELHPIFGRTLALQIDEMWRLMGGPYDFVVREFGAGSGALFLAILDGLVRIGSPLSSAIRYEAVDFARQRALITDRLRQAGRLGHLVPISEHNVPRAGVVMANEFVDALPVHRVILLKGQLREIHVDWRDKEFVEVAGPLTDRRLAAWFSESGMELVENQRAEVNLAMLDWVADLAQTFERGYVVTIDYGAGAAELYGPSRATGTIRAFSGQRVSSDVLSEPGTRDITSHVDFDALERQARACGFEICGRRKSSEFLLACGLDDAYQQARTETDDDWDDAMNLRSAIGRLLDSNSLGGYLVSVLAKAAPVDRPLTGFRDLRPQT
jgi:SAM-dependent MidA family methyltransferase